MAKNDRKIYVLFYKNGTIIRNDSLYMPLMAGNALTKANSQITGDDSGDNISDKNKYFSELTGIYWIWKNTKQQVVGVCHYRRFFTAKKEPLFYRLKRLFYYPARLYKKRLGLIYSTRYNFWKDKILNENELNDLLTRYDIVLPKARKLNYSVETHYKRYHDINDLFAVESIITEKYPEYLSAYKTVLQGKRLYANNMFIMKDHHFQEFMTWLFDILFEFERRINLEHYKGYQERIFGFMAERLLNVWIIHQSLKRVELPVVYFKNLKYE